MNNWYFSARLKIESDSFISITFFIIVQVVDILRSSVFRNWISKEIIAQNKIDLFLLDKDYFLDRSGSSESMFWLNPILWDVYRAQSLQEPCWVTLTRMPPSGPLAQRQILEPDHCSGRGDRSGLRIMQILLGWLSQNPPFPLMFPVINFPSTNLCPTTLLFDYKFLLFLVKEGNWSLAQSSPHNKTPLQYSLHSTIVSLNKSPLLF